MTSSEYNLIVVAHPDDEAIFFSSALLKNSTPARVICVTDGNADGMGEIRMNQFQRSCESLGAEKWSCMKLPDLYESRLDVKTIQNELKKWDAPATVYTHSPVGDYMHPHHQDVSYAVHHYFKEKCSVRSVAYNCFASETNALNGDQFRLKSRILAEIYGSETKRFLNLIPCAQVESFVELDYDEVSEIYLCLSGAKEKLDRSKLSAYLWLADYLEEKAKEPKKRLF